MLSLFPAKNITLDMSKQREIQPQLLLADDEMGVSSEHALRTIRSNMASKD